MRHQPSATRGRLRTVFVSDVHLGCRFSQAEKFLHFVESLYPEHLYIVGDFIDAWKLKRRWYWPSTYLRIFHRLMALSRAGTQIYYAPGNHDDFLRHFLDDFGVVHIADEFIHCTADERRFLVMHGDQFDEVERRFGWLSHVGSGLYDVVLWSNAAVNRLRRRLRLSDLQYSARLKLSVKHAMRFVSQYEDRLADYARELFCEGIICGHIHCPRITQIGEITYCNTGDWVEHCTAVVEHLDGRLELVEYSEDLLLRLPADNTPKLSVVNPTSAAAKSIPRPSKLKRLGI